MTYEKETEFYQTTVMGRNNLVLAIVDKEGDQHIGNIGIHEIDWVKSIGGYGIIMGRKDYWGKGYAEEATRLILDYAFCRLGIRKIRLVVHEKNEVAIKLYQKVGFVEEGRLVKEVFTNGQWYDHIAMGLFREDYVARFRGQLSDGTGAFR
jgi:RimJ/RimL family protein N-acetyltransferase